MPVHFGERAADVAVAIFGSWRYLIIQTAIVIVWILLNVWLLERPWDPYPLILLNLVFSTQASYAAPLVLMSQNRQATKDRARDDLESQEVALLVQINQRQLEILEKLNGTGEPRAGDVGASPAPSSGLGSEPSPPDAHQSTMSVKPTDRKNGQWK